MNSKVFNPFRDSARGILISVAMMTLLSACTTLREGKDRGLKWKVAPSAQVLETRVVVSTEAGKWHDFDFDVPESGDATLRLSNGARTDASLFDKFIWGVEVTLNGSHVLTPERFIWFNNVLRIPVHLKAGPNKLRVRFCSGSGKRMSFRIDAPADTVKLKRIRNSVVVGPRALRALAQVTGLGHPVRGAELRFEVSGVGDVPPSSTLTGDAGFAEAFLALKRAESGTLRATVVGSEPPLVAEIPIDAVNKRAIRLEQRPNFVSVNAGSSRSMSLAVHVLRLANPPNRVKLEIEPSSNGIVISDFPGELDVNAPETISLTPVIRGVNPGIYSVTTTATIMETGDSYTSHISVDVVDPKATDPLVLSRPASSPAGIPTSMTQTTVVFRALVSGTRTPPKDLCLIEVDAAGEALEPKEDPKDECVAVLLDDGKGRDSQAHDLFYSGSLKIGDPKLGNPVETERFYRVRIADYFGKTVTSDIESFNITNFPIERPLSKGPTAEDPKSNRMLYTNAVTFTVRRGTSAHRVKEIVSAVGGTVVGFWPPLRDYMVQIKGDGTAKGVYEAIAIILGFDDVAAASPNHVVVNPGVSTSDPEFSNQWYLPHVGVDDAWQLGAKGALTLKVASIDSGVDCSDTDNSHEDLRGICSGGNQTDLTGHGSLAGGIIAAKADNNMYIAGVDWYTRLIPFQANGSDQVRTAIDAARATEARIIFVNQNDVDVPELKTAVEGVINDGFLIVAAAGNVDVVNGVCNLSFWAPQDNMPGQYPAAYNGDPNLGGSITDEQRDELKRRILAVGATDQGDQLATDFTDRFGQARCSNLGDWIDLYAPGKDMISTVPQSFDVQPPDGLMTVSGTSFATPLVAGAAAVLWALDPNWSASKIHETLITTAPSVSVDLQNPNPKLGGYDDKLVGKGRLDLFAAVKEVLQPIIRFDRKETHQGSDGNLYDYYFIPVENWQVYPPVLFTITSAYGPCGLNPTPSRSWVDIFNATNDSRMYGFCAFNSPDDLTLIWFAVPAGNPPPASVYIELHDRDSNIRFRSNTLAIP